MYNLETMRFLFLSLIFLFAACSAQQTDQDGGNLTRSEVELLSHRMQLAIETEFPLLQHKVVNRYVNSLGQSLISRNSKMPPLPYEFRVLRTSEFLVFSLPGGVVYISLGALRAVTSEGEFASALAHELAHQQLNHQLIQWRRKVNSNRGGHYLLDFDGDWRERFLGAGGALVLSPAMEQEADELAPVILYQAHIEPRIYINYLQLLKRLEQTSLNDVAGMVRTHPPVNERLAWVKNALAKLPPLKEPDGSSSSFQQVKSLLTEAAKKTEKPANGKGKVE
jgi:predicted Zn-dependent protease